MPEQAQAMEPMLPSQDVALVEPALRTAQLSSALGSALCSGTRIAVVHLLRQVNGYYSNLLEGHTVEPVHRIQQLENVAHIEVQKLMEQKLASDSGFNISSADFLRWIHYEFYARMPEEIQHTVEPGEWRPHFSVPGLLRQFSELYDPQRFHGLERIIAVAASHHQLAWIHPFEHGNGRVARLFTHAFLIRTGLDANGLWTISRGLSQRRATYLAALDAGDRLSEFCKFFFETALDQIQFMRTLLDITGLQERMAGYVSRRADSRKVAPAATYLLREALLRGEIPRGDIPRVTGKPERTARRIVRHLLNEGLLVADTPKGPVRIGVPAKSVASYFPGLYPEGVDLDLPS